MTPEPEPAADGRTNEPASPYGPHPRGVDEAAGGADSSPHETEPTGEREEQADDANRPRDPN